VVHTFTYDGDFFALDVETGSVHMLDKPAYDAVTKLAHSDDPDGVLNAADDPMMIEIRALRDEGLLFSPPEDEIEKPANIIKAMCLHIAHDCNLRCGYCFAEGGAFAGRREMMSKEVARAAIDYLVSVSGNRRNMEIDFFGGEPTMNFDVLKDTVSYARSLEEKYGKNFRFTVTTNGYCVTDEMKDYFDANMNNIVVSIDGRKHVHDAVRITAGGNGSYEKVAANAKDMVLHRSGEYYVRGTFTADNLDFAEDVLHVADMGFYGLSIEPVVTKGANAIREEHLEDIYAEYERLAKEYERRRREGNGFVFFHFMVDLDGGPCKKKRIRGCGAGTEYIAIAPNGDIYPCHQFVGREKYRMGSVFEDGLDEDIAQEFDACNIYNMESCQSCWAKYYCSGGCAAANVNMNDDMMKPYEIGCKMQQKRLELAIAMAARELMEA